jgi:tRNA pseudouridine55 synthase
MTSRDAVNRVQKWFPRGTRIGHTGTLDPLATGVLVVCVGAATRLADYVQAMGKTYSSRFRLGATSTSDDADGVVAEKADVETPGRERVEVALGTFVGTIEQVPPAVSALKVAGERAHDLARQGRVVELAARPVRIDAIRLVGYEWPFVDVEVDCGKGTYIRSIARDLGVKLGVGGLVQTLRRTRVGPFTAGEGIGVEERPAVLPLLPMVRAVAGLPPVRVGAEEARRFRQGQRLRLPSAIGGTPGSEAVAVLDESGGLVGVGTVGAGWVKPALVLGC